MSEVIWKIKIGDKISLKGEVIAWRRINQRGVSRRNRRRTI
jgi:tartrate dehydratase beta subunit/fumarate hydratase class I family protein